MDRPGKKSFRAIQNRVLTLLIMHIIIINNILETQRTGGIKDVGFAQRAARWCDAVETMPELARER
jgi:hypothetical protein